MSDQEVRQLIASTRATYERDADALLRVIAEVGGLPCDPALAEPFLESYVSIFGWLLNDEVVTIDGSATGAMMRAYNRLRGSDQFSSLVLPANWLDIAREWLLGEEPATELGRLEAEFFAGRPYPPSPGAD
jgi:hypothetical protein